MSTASEKQTTKKQKSATPKRKKIKSSANKPTPVIDIILSVQLEENDADAMTDTYAEMQMLVNKLREENPLIKASISWFTGMLGKEEI